MGKNNTVLIKVSYLVELNNEDLTNEEDILDKITSKVGRNEQFHINGKNIELKWNNTSSFILDEINSNCGRCSNCGGWVTDREKDNAIPELCNGVRVNGKLLCDECLHHKHKLAF